MPSNDESASGGRRSIELDEDELETMKQALMSLMAHAESEEEQKQASELFERIKEGESDG